MKRMLLSPPHLQPAYAQLGYGVGAFPITEAIHREVLSLPMGPQLPAMAQARVVAAVGTNDPQAIGRMIVTLRRIC